VEHSKFGEGKVQSVEGQGEKATAVVFFGTDVGNKKLKLKYARLRVIG
jgi:DNA helicase-2/ATP-dependent DNA helicase PcrA